MSDLERRAAALAERMRLALDKATNEIKEKERTLSGLPGLPEYTNGSLRWDPKLKRICKGDRPLGDCPVGVRKECMGELHEFVEVLFGAYEAIVKEMEGA